MARYIVSVLSIKVNWTVVAKNNGTATISENQFLMRHLVTLIIDTFLLVAMLVITVLQLYKKMGRNF